MSNLWTVIPAAGESHRFKDAGYTLPKPLLYLESKHHTRGMMINHVTKDFPDWIVAGLIIAFPRSIKDIIVKSDMLDTRIVWIDKTTGQADTTYQVVKDLQPNDQVLVLDCDMILNITDIKIMIDLGQIYDVVIAVTETFDPNASRVDSIPYPTRFAEKEPISQYGIIGARLFKNAGLLTEALKRTIDRYNSIHQEPYLSVAINHYSGRKYAYLISDYTDLGTPQRIEDAGWKIL